jgi:hypothetical protein
VENTATRRYFFNRRRKIGDALKDFAQKLACPDFCQRPIARERLNALQIAANFDRLRLAGLLRGFLQAPPGRIGEAGDQNGERFSESLTTVALEVRTRAHVNSCFSMLSFKGNSIFSPVKIEV